MARDYGRIHILVHSLANAPQVQKPPARPHSLSLSLTRSLSLSLSLYTHTHTQVEKPLLETNRASYLGASSASAYSMVSLVQVSLDLTKEVVVVLSSQLIN